MKKKLESVLFAVMVLIVSIPKYSFAAESGKPPLQPSDRTGAPCESAGRYRLSRL